MPTPPFTVLDEQELAKLPKAQKPQDMGRMQNSPESEDYVTWSVLRLLLRRHTDQWWPAVLRAAHDSGPALCLVADPNDPPEVVPWHRVPSPDGYEHLSRERMIESRDERLMNRAKKAAKVEGCSEIDLVFRGKQYLVFVEAKLHCDVSLETTYDPERNQILRNIDCLLEQAGSRSPFFWMLVKDRSAIRAYVRILEQYRRDPVLLYQALPHRDQRLLDQVLRGVALATWADLLAFLFAQGFSGTEAAVLGEIARRVTTDVWA
ncbi:MAG TPA: hypothetical protein VGN26_14115 [Armatimonadota bacterium]|jgi:hypothetical protein